MRKLKSLPRKEGERRIYKERRILSGKDKPRKNVPLRGRNKKWTP